MAITNYPAVTTVGTGAYTSVGDNAVTVMYLTNITASGVAVEVYVVPSADTSTFEASPTAGYKIYNALTVPANDTYVIDSEKLILADGDKIYVTAGSDSAINVTVSTIGV
jgi:hypothetical protein